MIRRIIRVGGLAGLVPVAGGQLAGAAYGGWVGMAAVMAVGVAMVVAGVCAD